MTPLQEIKEKFDKVISFSQPSIPDPDTQGLLDQWFDAKRDIIEAFGGKYIYELPEKVSFEITEDAKQERINSFINMLWEFGFDELGRFLDYQRDGFFKNQVVEEYEVCDSKKTVITKGTKLLKAFKYFIEKEEVLHDLQNKASLILQENKIEGRLCFSVHPLDFLSVSENTYNWRSCHALNGEYRAGNLSYMVDEATIVCYLKGENEVKLPNFPQDVPWNSKKWRVLLYLSNDWKMIFAGKQYPFSTDSGMNLLLENFNKKINPSPDLDSWERPAKESFWSPWSTFCFEEYKRDIGEGRNVRYDFHWCWYPMAGGLVKLQELVKDATGSKHFNDVLRSSCYTPMYTQLVAKEFYGEDYYTYANNRTKFTIGGPTYCLRCGREEVVESCSTMMCYDCELNYGTSENDTFGYCACCGARIEIEKSFYVGDDTYCEHCYNERAARCSACGDSYPIEDMIYDDETGEYTCHWCNDQDEQAELEVLEECFQRDIKNLLEGFELWREDRLPSSKQ